MGTESKLSETCVPGNARFMNTWLAAGPFGEPVPADSFTGKREPKRGELLTTTEEGEKIFWEYFDDRIFNRNQDDYNDLMGYLCVKQGRTTNNKYAAAAVYVYSEEEKAVCWQFAGSGKYTLFCNGAQVGEQQAVPADVKKSGEKYPIILKCGWNQLFLQMQHVNPGRDSNLMGFYSRLCDKEGNRVEGLTCSVCGPHTKEHAPEIVTQGLEIDRKAFEERNANCPANEYPANILPFAYEKNPYVWLEAKTGTECWKCQASPFVFQAGGGMPGYRWTVKEGALPDGLMLEADGSISGVAADGTAQNGQKDYPFTVEVTDRNGMSACKEFVMTVKVNPVEWFEQGRMSALSHCTGSIPNLYDPNYNYDEWAKTAKEMGLTMLSTESFQCNIYYWPSPNANLTPEETNLQYHYNAMYQKENGEWAVIDRVAQAKAAAERYGLHFGVYLSPEHTQTDMQGLVKLYNPWYIFVDGNPQEQANMDIAFSSARNYNDRILIDTNPYVEVSDQDVTLMERGFWNAQAYAEPDLYWEKNLLPQGKYVVHEQWNDPYGTALDVWKMYTPGKCQMRDAWPYAAMELIDAVGHGYVMNYDLSITSSRGMDNLVTDVDPENAHIMAPLFAQQMSDMRLSIANWMSNEKGSDLHESLFGTKVYPLSYVPKEGWHTPGTQQAYWHGEGPEWGYALCRDQNVYLHMIKNQIGAGRSKTGFTGQTVMEGIGPFADEAEKVCWMNAGKDLPFTQEKRADGYYLSIDTSSVIADPIDTIVKVVTKSAERKYALTGIKVFAGQNAKNALQLKTECYLNNYVSFSVPAVLQYSSSDASVASVDENTGLVTAGADGKAVITVTASYEDGIHAPQVCKEQYPVCVCDGMIFADLALAGVGMFTNEKHFWNEGFAGTGMPVTMVGYTMYGGTVDLPHSIYGSETVYHYARIDGATDRPDKKVEITEVSSDEVPFTVEDGLLKLETDVTDGSYYCYWAEVTVNGKTYTTSRNFVVVRSDRNIAEGIVPAVSSGKEGAAALSDGIINDAAGGNLLKWVSSPADDNPTITYDFGKEYALTRVNLFFNRHMPRPDAVTYCNVPKEIRIEYSADGKEWTCGNHLTKQSGTKLPSVDCRDEVPTADETSYAWEAENLFYNYPVSQSGISVPARYVRLSFPGGGQNGSPVEILEARIFAGV